MAEQQATEAAAPAGTSRLQATFPLLTDLRRAGLLPALVLHLLATGPSYGNQLMDRIRELTGGMLAVNPNTMYPLLRSLEERGLVNAHWEHPQRRSRRFYTLTPAGETERAKLAVELAPRLDAVAAGLALIRRELSL
jgi:DNA-binding PadR family transcriptional regulator